MTVAAFPHDEERRLASLRKLEILDTPPEERFDRITRVASELFGVPMALISLVDADRQWFKSRLGLEHNETPRDISFCAHAILGSDVFYVPDTLSDPRFSDSPLVTEDKIRFYAGCPIAGPDDQMIGTLCIMDRYPHDLSDVDKQLLKDLGAWAHAEMTSFHLLRSEIVQNRNLLREKEEEFFRFLDGLPVGVFVVDADGNPHYANRTAEQLLGKGISEKTAPGELSEVYKVYVAGTDREYPVRRLPVVRALGGMSNEAEDLEIHRPDGIMAVQVWATPIYDQHGRITHGIAAFQDITNRKRTEKRLAAQYAVSLAIAESKNLDEASPRILQAIGESMGLSVGAMWLVDSAEGTIHCRDFWHPPDQTLPDFESLTRRFVFPPGIGLPGRIWSRGEPAWVSNIVEDDNFPRTPAALKDGLHAAFGFPIRFQNQVIGVIEFFSKQIHEPDRELLAILNSLGMQIGQFIGRRQIEELLEDTRERYRQLTESIE